MDYQKKNMRARCLMISMEEVVDTSISILKEIIEAIEFMEPSVREEDMEKILGTVDREESLF